MTSDRVRARRQLLVRFVAANPCATIRDMLERLPPEYRAACRGLWKHAIASDLRALERLELLEARRPHGPGRAKTWHMRGRRYVLGLGERHCPENECVAPRTRCVECPVLRLTERLRQKNLAMVRAGMIDASTPPASRGEDSSRAGGIVGPWPTTKT